MRDKILQRLREKMGESDIDSLIIGSNSNIQYLTGFSGDFGYIVINRKRSLFFTNPLFIEEARSSVDDLYEIIETEGDLFKSFESLDGSLWGKRVGFEEEKTTFSSYTKLKKILAKRKPVPTAGIVEDLREIKENHEIKAVKHAQEIAERIFADVLSIVSEGVEECELANEIDYRFRKEGGKGSAFETIVASGPNTSKPHAVPSRRKIHNGDLVLFDMGTVVDGYSSDMTRTVVLGKADDEQKKVYGIVLDAQKAALAKMKSGMQCSEADRIAREIVEKSGYGDRFVHSLGHGVGLEVHENPYLSKRSKKDLRENSIVTVEPGIYIPGWGGIRIEDMVLIKEGGCVNLTGAPKEFIEL